MSLPGERPAPADDDPAAADCWRALGLLAARARCQAGPIASCWLRIGTRPEVGLGGFGPGGGAGGAATDSWRVSLALDAGAAGRLPPPAAGETRYRIDDLVVPRRVTAGDLPPAAAELVELYAPYCLAAAHARRVGRPFTVSHFAQSLDGRIATGNGDSKGIGCAGNLLHAHRMRALCDGILIGAGTLRADRPALTVRHAVGADPARVVVGRASAADVECLLAAGPGPVLLAGDGGGGPLPPQVERLELPRRDGRIATAALLGALYRRGILSVYVEGGAATTSAFLAEGTLDVVQLHLAPLVLGAGIPSFTRPPVDAVADGVRFAAHLYRPVGEGVMFVGRVAA